MLFACKNKDDFSILVVGIWVPIILIECKEFQLVIIQSTFK